MIEQEQPLAPGLALIFDIDGVLVDSNPLHRETWAAFNRRYGVETTEAMHRFMYGKRNDDIVRHFFGAGLSDDEIHSRGAAKEALYREFAAERLPQMLLPGLREFLEMHHSVPMAVASNGEPENVRLVLDRGDLRRYFRVVVDGHQVANPKPHPEIYLRVADLLQVPPGDSIVFEDSHTGVEAALAAGMRVVGICTTHVDLPGTSISVDNFQSRVLRQWLASQRPLQS